jgi:hypothetical protein
MNSMSLYERSNKAGLLATCRVMRSGREWYCMYIVYIAGRGIGQYHPTKVAEKREFAAETKNESTGHLEPLIVASVQLEYPHMCIFQELQGIMYISRLPKYLLG